MNKLIFVYISLFLTAFFSYEITVEFNSGQGLGYDIGAILMGFILFSAIFTIGHELYKHDKKKNIPEELT